MHHGVAGSFTVAPFAFADSSRTMPPAALPPDPGQAPFLMTPLDPSCLSTLQMPGRRT